MQRRTLLMLVALVLALAGLALWQSRRETGGPFGIEEPLCPGLVAARVQRIRIDNVERSEVIVFQRGGTGWLIVDPFEYPAESTYPELLARLAELSVLLPAPEGQTSELAALGLDPPRAVIEWRELLQDGTERAFELELGRVDPDRERVLVRTRGRLGTTTRGIETTVDRYLREFRSRTILAIPPRAVIEVVRGGRDPVDERVLDAELLLEPEGWWLTRPRRARLDPPSAGLIVGVLAGLTAESFVDDAHASLEELGLGPRAVRFELGTASGERHQVEIGRAENGRWTARRPSEPWVWELDPSVVELLFSEPDVWIDRALVRARRDDLARVVIAGPRGPIVLRPGARGGFELELDGAWREADSRAVADLLGQLEEARLGGLLDQAPGADPEGRSVRLELVDGNVQGFELLETVRLETLERVRALRRLEDGVAGWVDPALETLFEPSLEELLSPRLLPGVEEMTSERLEVASGSRERVFVRRPDGVWVEEGHELPARELVGLLDPLFFLRSAARLPAGEHAPLEQEVRVALIDREGVRRGFSIGRVRGADGQSRVEIALEGTRAVADHPELHAGLLSLLGD